MDLLHHGGDIYSYERPIVDFSANINFLGMPEGVKKAYISAADTIINYPDPLCRDLVKAISVYENIPAENIFCGNGAADLIYRTVYGLKPQRGLLPAPTFSEYGLALQSFGANISYYALSEADDFKIEESILEAIGEGDMVFICNPNNPTGQITEKRLLIKILKRAEEKGAYLALDECFLPFLIDCEAYTLKEFIHNFKNLIIFRAFTKFYAMAGLRLGYAMASAEILDKLRESGQAWPVSTVAQLCGIEALKDHAFIQRTKVKNQEERKYLSDALSQTVKVYPGYGNYIFFKSEIVQLKEKLLEFDLLIRDCSNYKGLKEGFYRTAVKKRNENAALIRALNEIKRREKNG